MLLKINILYYIQINCSINVMFAQMYIILLNVNKIVCKDFKIYIFTYIYIYINNYYENIKSYLCIYKVVYYYH